MDISKQIDKLNREIAQAKSRFDYCLAYKLKAERDKLKKDNPTLENDTLEYLKTQRRIIS